MVWSYFLFLIWFIYLIASSILLFTRGFLLTRDSLEFNSTCVTFSQAPCSSGGDSHDACTNPDKLQHILSNIKSASSVCLPKRAKVVVIIIDALRYDFTLYDEENKNPLPYQNKLPVIQETLTKDPERTRLYKFIADPPTTTMQRLKAMTTGTLPTFIDLGSNFASYEIREDNIIDQVIRNNLSVVFMGDDTWNGLYPKRFKRAYPFPSFNVRDLDTVDQGVTKNLYPELEKNDWELLIGHYLGVDHAGHRYGPNHSEMKRKLEEMNQVIESVIEKMTDDMILYVLGDHGMTATGDHGGESSNEVGSALFVHSKLPLARPQNETSIKQVNLVPTLSAILGVPIPFSNLGSTILDAIPAIPHPSIPQWKISLFATWSNVEQITEYLRKYSRDSETFKGDKLKEIAKKFNTLKSKVTEVTGEKSFEKFQKYAYKYMGDVRKMCEEEWVKFDAFSISRGLLLLFFSVFFVHIIADGVPLEYLKQLYLSAFLKCSYIVVAASAFVTSMLYYYEVIDDLILSIFFATGLVSQFMLAMLIVQNWDTISLNWHEKSKKDRFESISCRLVMTLTQVGLLSNSYIEEEASALLFLLSTVSVLLIYHCAKEIGREKGAAKWSRCKFVLFCACAVVVLRLSVNFWRCREEQGSCFSNINVAKETSKGIWAVSLASLLVFVMVTKKWLRNCGSLNDPSFTVTLAKYAPFVMAVCAGGFWVLHKSPVAAFKVRAAFRWKSDHLVWTIYGTCLFGIVCTVLRPLLIYILPRQDVSFPDESNVIPSLFERVKGLMGKRSSIPVIYGLGTVYSSVFVVIGVYFTLVVSVLLGEAEAPSAVIMFVTAMFFLVVISCMRIERATKLADLLETPNVAVLTWVLASHYFFYATGHQPAWSNIDWNAAFIGTSMTSNHFIQGTLVVLNTFCPYILMGFLVPMMVITPFTLFVMTPWLLKRNKGIPKDLINQGELLLFENNDLMVTSVFVCCCKYLACHAIRVFSSMLAATVHCRHLMVWKIFAPKFIFESIAMFVTLISVILGYLVLIRINNHLGKFLYRLNKQVR